MAAPLENQAWFCNWGLQLGEQLVEWPQSTRGVRTGALTVPGQVNNRRRCRCARQTSSQPCTGPPGPDGLVAAVHVEAKDQERRVSQGRHRAQRTAFASATLRNLAKFCMQLQPLVHLHSHFKMILRIEVRVQTASAPRNCLQSRCIAMHVPAVGPVPGRRSRVLERRGDPEEGQPTLI